MHAKTTRHITGSVSPQESRTRGKAWARRCRCLPLTGAPCGSKHRSSTRQRQCHGSLQPLGAAALRLHPSHVLDRREALHSGIPGLTLRCPATAGLLCGGGVGLRLSGGPAPRPQAHHDEAAALGSFDGRTEQVRVRRPSRLPRQDSAAGGGGDCWQNKNATGLGSCWRGTGACRWEHARPAAVRTGAPLPRLLAASQHLGLPQRLQQMVIHAAASAAAGGPRASLLRAAAARAQPRRHVVKAVCGPQGAGSAEAQGLQVRGAKKREAGGEVSSRVKERACSLREQAPGTCEQMLQQARRQAGGGERVM
jgi:hypothetical protein